MDTTSLTNERHFPGYTVSTVTRLENMDADMIRLEHVKTGARHIHIATPDKENTFGVLFRTVPTDSSGVAHILEHTVLCGSRNFNVRDPFFSMIKRSLSTFMNAFTSSDWTMYPFSTQNPKDYFNLMNVYLDAAFFPKIDELSFKQEGHRLELTAADTGNPVLEYKGVVYNEMKGAMSSPAQVMGRSLLSALYPDTTYRNNSGGDPMDIPRLTHENLKRFHATYYHPSNAWFYTYGDLPLENTLKFISEKVLNGFDRIRVDSKVPSQPRWIAPRRKTQTYAYSDSEDLSRKYQTCVAWLTCDATDSFEILVLSVLEQVLIGNAASPLRKALIDSSLGSALSDATGFDSENRDTLFACGLKDITADAIPKVEKIIFDTLRKLVRQGIDPSMTESAIHQIEFYRKEITNTPYPFGIKLLLDISSALIHEGDPVACINIDKDLDELKQRLKKGGFLEKCLKRYFLDNPHRVRFTLKPDPKLEERTRQKTRKELRAVLKSMTSAELEAIRTDARALEALQEKEEDVSVLPTLELSDVPPEIEIIRPDRLPGIRLATAYDKATSGILYFTCPMGAGAIAPDLYALVPFFCRAFTNAGTRHHTYDRIAERMDLYTGGISMIPFSGSYFSKEAQSHSFVAIQGKALDRNLENMFDLIEEFLADYDFNDLERIKNLIRQYQAGLESSIVAAGHRYAISLSSRHLSRASHINELWHGVAQYRMIRQITDALGRDDTSREPLQFLADRLSLIARSVLNRGNLKPALIGGKEAVILSEKKVQAIHESLPNHTEPSFFTPDIPFSPEIPFDGWYTNTAVSFVGQSFKTVRMNHDDSPALAVIAKILKSLYLHREIREKGGAYGGFAIYNSEEGLFSFGSYRDPHIERTLNVYQKACDYIIGGEYSETDVKEAILQVCSDIDKPETPGPAAMKAFYRDITRLDDDIRRKFKDGLLSLTREKIKTIAETYFTLDEARKGTAVISSRVALEKANQSLSGISKPLALFKI